MGLDTDNIWFRGKRKDTGEWITGEWITGDLRHWWNGKVAISERGGIAVDAGIEVEATTVGQFTGLYDINDRKIFVGDIVISHTAKKERIWEHISKGSIVAVPGKFMLQCPDGCVDIMAIPEFEIVGNIHEEISNE